MKRAGRRLFGHLRRSIEIGGVFLEKVELDFCLRLFVPLLTSCVLADGGVGGDECLGLATVPHGLTAVVPIDSLARGAGLRTVFHLPEDLGDATQEVRRPVQLFGRKLPEGFLPGLLLHFCSFLLRLPPSLAVFWGGRLVQDGSRLSALRHRLRQLRVQRPRFSVGPGSPGDVFDADLHHGVHEPADHLIGSRRVVQRVLCEFCFAVLGECRPVCLLE